MKSRRKKTLITHMRDKDGKEHTARQKIADIFADFYEDLYDKVSSNAMADNLPQGSLIEPFTEDEVKTEVKELKKGKSKDRSGIAAEMIKEGGDGLISALTQLYNDIIKHPLETPSSWKRASITILFK
eukprot:2205911-Karenia_brevis.AAC.1